jgi:hypothetical protein
MLVEHRWKRASTLYQALQPHNNLDLGNHQRSYVTNLWADLSMTGDLNQEIIHLLALQQWPRGRGARMTSGASAANSAACLRMSAALVVAQRVSIRYP